MQPDSWGGCGESHSSGSPVRSCQLFSSSGIKVRAPWTERQLLRPLLLLLLQLQLLTIPAITAGAREEGREEEREHRPLAKPRISRLSLGDLGSPGACLWHKHRGGSPVVFYDLSRWQSPFGRLEPLAASSGKRASLQLGSLKRRRQHRGGRFWPAW